jgi:hypothetical protein
MLAAREPDIYRADTRTRGSASTVPAAQLRRWPQPGRSAIQFRHIVKAASGAAYLSAKTSLRAVVLSRTADVSTSAITGESAHHPDESRQLDHKQRIGDPEHFMEA